MDAGRKRVLEAKVAVGERLTREDAEALDACDDLAWLGGLAHRRRAGLHGDRVTFALVPQAPAESLRAFAVSRLVLDNVAHIRCSLAAHGSSVAQLALNFGADDLEGSAEAVEDLVELIGDAGFQPVERDAAYNVVVEHPKPPSLAERRSEPQKVWA